MNIIIIGAGAAGTFSAIRAKQSLLEKGDEHTQVILLEKSGRGLRKVKISGGGRCNVTHHPYPIKTFLKNYPRGQKELISAFHQFNAEDTVRWFEERGVKIIKESDGRMFPSSNSSQTIIDCFEKEKEKLGVKTFFNSSPKEIIPKDRNFIVRTQNKDFQAVAVIVATGSDHSGFLLATKLGHTLTEMAPSLFTFKVKHPLLRPLQGTVFEKAQISLKVSKKKFEEEGPMLVTHWGLSGPAILKISAWAARELKNLEYHFEFRVNFLGAKEDDIINDFLDKKRNSSKKDFSSLYPKGVTKNFWKHFLKMEFPHILNKKWGDLSKKDIHKLAQTLTHFSFSSIGPHRYKDEFVECGGIRSKEINFKTLESLHHPGLFFAGEILDVDGLTGGFNFQNCWSTGLIAGENAAKRGLKTQE